jgi:hypothetical protein
LCNVAVLNGFLNGTLVGMFRCMGRMLCASFGRKLELFYRVIVESIWNIGRAHQSLCMTLMKLFFLYLEVYANLVDATV